MCILYSIYVNINYNYGVDILDSLINENYHILNMVHDTVKPLGNGYYFCTDKGIKSVIDEYGNEVLKGESIINIGEFIKPIR